MLWAGKNAPGLVKEVTSLDGLVGLGNRLELPEKVNCKGDKTICYAESGRKCQGILSLIVVALGQVHY